MKTLKFLKSVGIDLLTFSIILTVFLVAVGLVGFFITSTPIITAIANIIATGLLFVIILVIVIEYLKKKWREVK